MGMRRGFPLQSCRCEIPMDRSSAPFGLSCDIPDKNRAEEKLAALARELREKNETLEQDLEMARELQHNAAALLSSLP